MRIPNLHFLSPSPRINFKVYRARAFYFVYCSSFIISLMKTRTSISSLQPNRVRLSRVNDDDDERQKMEDREALIEQEDSGLVYIEKP